MQKMKTYHKGLLLASQNILHTLLQLLGARLGVGNCVPATDLLLQALPEIRLSALVLLDLAAEVAVHVLDLTRDTGVTGAGGLLDALELVAQVAQRSVDLVLDVVDALARGLVLLASGRVEKRVLCGCQLALALGAQLIDRIVHLSAFVKDHGRAAGLLHVGHFCGCRVRALSSSRRRLDWN